MATNVPWGWLLGGLAAGVVGYALLAPKAASALPKGGGGGGGGVLPPPQAPYAVGDRVVVSAASVAGPAAAALPAGTGALLLRVDRVTPDGYVEGAIVGLAQAVATAGGQTTYAVQQLPTTLGPVSVPRAGVVAVERGGMFVAI